jgi:hypothetical protein
LQVKIRGVRIELSEIELRLLEHESVQEAVTRVFEPDPGDKRLVAYVVPSSGHTPHTADLAAFLRRTLPESMVPAAFVVLDSLPLAPNGKVDRRALPAPDFLTPGSSTNAFVAPSTATERALAGIWTALLRVRQVGVTDSFFELGGHSLLATQLASRVRSQLHVDLPLRQYFAAPTLGGQAALIERSARETGVVRAPAIPRVSRDLYRVRISPAGEFVLPAALTLDGDPSSSPVTMSSPIPRAVPRDQVSAASPFARTNAASDDWRVSFLDEAAIERRTRSLKGLLLTRSALSLHCMKCRREPCPSAPPPSLPLRVS